MDVCDFIDSRDVRDYLRTINYAFTAPEAAFLVWLNKTATLDARIDAWERIIETMPDCSMLARSNMVEIPSFREFLCAYIDLQKRKRDWFPQSQDVVFCYAVVGNPYDELCGAPYEIVSNSGPFSTYELCRKRAMDETAWLYSEALQAGEAAYPRIIVAKHQIDSSKDHSRGMNCTLNATGDVLTIGDAGSAWGFTESDWDIDQTFEGMWFDFPVPFHAGDILYDPLACADRGVARPLVLTELCAWGADAIARELPASEFSEDWLLRANSTLEHCSRYADESDMGFFGYKIEDGVGTGEPRLLRNRFCTNYLRLERYRGVLEGPDRALAAVSEYVKTGNAEFLVNAYRALVLLEQKKRADEHLTWMQDCYTEEALCGIGLFVKHD